MLYFVEARLILHHFRLPGAQDIVSGLRDFYTSMFPKRSEFELPVGLRNKFLYVDDLREYHLRSKAVCAHSR